MSEFDAQAKRDAQKRVDNAKKVLEDTVRRHARTPGPVSPQGKREIESAKDRLKMAYTVRKRVKKSGPGKDSYRGGGPQDGVGRAPGPRG